MNPLNALKPHDVGTAPADNVHLHIDDSGGDGQPVVLIHGWPLSAQAWEPQVSVLQAAGYRVVAYDRRGFGRSDKPESGYGYDTLADDLARVLEQCELHDVTLVGFSMGGGEVARYVSRHGDADAIVPIEGSGLRTHQAVPHSQLVTVNGAPHGLNLSHAKAFNDALLAFLRAHP